MNDYAKVFVSVNTEKVMPTVSKELAIEFLESIPFNEEQAEIINKKTVYQSQSQFWFDHLRESTDRRNTFNPFAPEPSVTARADPGPFYPL